MNAELLVFAPHPDDAELGMGGAIARWTRQGKGVAVVDMSDGEPTPHGSPQIRRKELIAASEALGLAHRRQLDLVNRLFRHDVESRYKVAAVIRQYRPRVVFAPFLPDAHPDHVAAAQIVRDACFDAKLTHTDIPGQPHHPRKIVYYYCTHLMIHPQPTFVLDVSDAYQQKAAALEAYQSQFYIKRGADAGRVPEMIRVRDRYFGSRIGVEYGEPFFTHELVGLADVDALL
jgi:bacillithiol biosynthesis deacetylase BshB1